MKTAYLGLGSNMGDREATLREAARRLWAEDLRVARVSSFYETEPMYVTGQPRFLNQVAEIETALLPMQLLHRVLGVERELGRRRTVAKGPRTFDIDVLLYGRFVVESPRLVIPHPGMHERRFVLEPLAELNPELRHPVLKKTMRELMMALGPQGVRRVGAGDAPGTFSPPRSEG